MGGDLSSVDGEARSPNIFGGGDTNGNVPTPQCTINMHQNVFESTHNPVPSELCSNVFIC